MTSNLDAFLKLLLDSPEYSSRIVHLKTFDPRPPAFAPDEQFPDGLLGALLSRAGLNRLYEHQAEALRLARSGKDQVVVTGTSSGKTLCYNLAILDKLLAQPRSKALYLFPTKALAQDQLRSLNELLAHLPAGIAPPLAETYDGDTPTHRRKRIRTSASMLFSNPDMLHQSILPNHPRWAEFFRNLSWVVLDEIHSYRGVFGSNVANVLRRMDRICRHYGSAPQYICTSATIANPLELAGELTGRKFEAISGDASPRGCRYFLFWNPPPSRRNPLLRRNALSEAQLLLELLLKSGVQSLVFLRARSQAEMLYRYLREKLERESPELVSRIRSYRGGYLPSERREIEAQLFSGQLLAVTTTNALELGIDVGQIQASLIVGYPGTLASIWQQAGRAGRGLQNSLAIFIASNEPEDQYLVRNPDWLLEGSVEAAAIDPQNPYILANHLGCAAYELPLKSEEQLQSGGLSRELTGILEQEDLLRQIDGRWYWSSPEYPSGRTNLRTMSGRSFSISLGGAEPQVIGTLDEASVQLMAHPGAIYLHEGDTFRVRNLDFETAIASVEQVDVDYYTRPLVQSQLRVNRVRESAPFGNGQAQLSDVETSWSVIAFRKIKFYTQDNLGVEALSLPTQQMQTISLCLAFDSSADGDQPSHSGTLMRGLQALQSVFSSALPMLAMCDRADMGSLIQMDPDRGRPALYLFDRYPGGMGFAERGFENIRELFKLAHKIVAGCGCASGCPSCVGVAEPAFAGTAGLDQFLPDKSEALRLLQNALKK